MPADPYQRARQAQESLLQRRRRRPRRRTTAASMLAAGSPRQRQGRRAEHHAAEYLLAHRIQILARNLHCRCGELDLVARDAATLVFIEVRERNGTQGGGAAASVNRRKQQRLIRTAHFFLPWLVRAHFGGIIPPCRFDVVCVEDGRLTWIRQAFTQ